MCVSNFLDQTLCKWTQCGNLRIFLLIIFYVKLQFWSLYGFRHQNCINSCHQKIWASKIVKLISKENSVYKMLIDFLNHLGSWHKWSTKKKGKKSSFRKCRKLSKRSQNVGNIFIEYVEFQLYFLRPPSN